MTNQAQLDASVIIVNYNGGSYLLDCVAALSDGKFSKEIIIVDNASEDKSAQTCKSRFTNVTVIYSTTNLGFAGGINLGVAHAHGKCFIFLNPDTVPGPGCIDRLVEEVFKYGGVVGPVATTAGESTPEYGMIIDRMGLPQGLQEPSPPLYVPGFCIATSPECFYAVGGLDQRYFLFYEDTEYCWQALRRGHEVRIAQSATLVHVGGTSASGGYRRHNRIESTSTRIVLGGRNSLTMFLACAPASKLPIVIFGALLRNCIFAIFLIMAGRPRTALALAKGLWWNIREVPATLQRRHKFGVTAFTENLAWSRISRRYFIFAHLFAGDKIRLVDE